MGLEKKMKKKRWEMNDEMRGGENIIDIKTMKVLIDYANKIKNDILKNKSLFGDKVNENRYYLHEHLFEENEIYDRFNCRFLKSMDIVDELNEFHNNCLRLENKVEELQKELKKYESTLLYDVIREGIKFKAQNENLKKENIELVNENIILLKTLKENGFEVDKLWKD